MKLITISPKLSHRLLITPQLKEALHILQLPLFELKTYLTQRIEENPLLQTHREKEIKTEIEKLLYSDPEYSRNDKIGLTDTDEQTSLLENIKSTPSTLQDRLQHQLKMTFLKDSELRIAEEIISHIDNNGYLREDLESLSSNLGFSLGEIQTVLETIQSLEPPGVGARNLQECLLIQLKNMDKKDSLVYKIVESCFKELSRKKYDVIAKKLKVSLEAVKEAVKEITPLNPKPGASFSQERTVTIIPDTIIKQHKNSLKITLNEEELPKLKINNRYKRLLNDPDTSEEIKEFIRNKVKDAVWLIKAVEQRQKNVRKVMQQIVKVQKQAIVTDLSNIKPLTLKDVAKNTRLHLSTIGRIVANKYISTPQGTIRLKNLFSTKFKSNDGAIYSDKNIVSKIQQIINTEDREKPLTDQVICDILRKSGIQISRRTVAKYRNKLKIPPSFLR